MPAAAPPPTAPAAPPVPPPAVDKAAVDKSTDRVRDMFAAIAGRYDLMNRVLTGGLDVLWRRRIAALDLGAGPVLDGCTGTGDLALALKKRRPGLRVVGVDFTHAMLARAVEKGGRVNHDRGVSWVEGDGEALPFADAAFTAATVGFGLRNIADTRRGLRELHRVLAPGGLLVVLETSRPTNPLVRPLFAAYFGGVVPKLGRLLAGNPAGAYDYLPASAAEFPDGEKLCELMRGCGFGECAFDPVGFGAATIYTGRKS